MNTLKPRRVRANSVTTRSRSSSGERSGIILLVVLGMLTLFSVLGVSYLVFTSRQRSAAANIHKSETGRIDTKKLVEDSLTKLLVGTDGPESSLWGHDLLGDLYGMRDSVEGQVTAANTFVAANELDRGPALLLENQFLRFPTELYQTATFPFRRDDAQVQRDYPGPAATRFAVDDMLNGRLLTFEQGPLEGLTFPIVRSFGDHRNINAIAAQGREQLTGQVVIDLREHIGSSIEIDGESKTLQEWFNTPSFNADRLIYNGLVATNPAAYGDFYINGRILNGPGLGWDVPRTNFSTTSGTNFNLNEFVSTQLNVTQLKDRPATFTPNVGDVPFTNNRFESGGFDLPVAYQGHYGLHRLPADFNVVNQLQAFVAGLPPGDTDEPYDAADYNNLWLSYFPNDPQLGEPTPSFVRPALLNWIFNQAGNLSSLSVQELRRVLYALQRSTLRPLPFVGDTAQVPDSIAARSPGVLQLRYGNFTGGNSSDGLIQPINIASTDTNYLAGRITSVASALAGADTNGDGVIDTWDVDNNGDGFPDSVFVDAGLPLSQDPSGRLYKPLVAYMVEDLGGRVDVNRAGNLAQARNLISTTMAGAIPQQAPTVQLATGNSPVGAGGAQYSRNEFPTGFGYGPAEIDLRSLFVPNFARPNLADRLRFGPQRILGDRLKTWSLTLGRVPSFSDLATNNTFIAAGELRDPLTSTPIAVNGNDWLGAIRDPLRANLHNFTRSQGLPMDTFGRATVGLDVGGGVAVAHASQTVPYAGAAAGDSDDDPYEFRADASTDPDAPYTYGELESLLRFDGFDRDLAASRLIELIEQYHNQAPTNRTQLDQISQLKRILAESITSHSNSAAVATGMLPSEWQVTSALARDVRTGATTTAANAALSPQQLFFESLDLSSVPVAQRDQTRNAWLWELLPPELRAGGRLNLNRPLGNGMNEARLSGVQTAAGFVNDDDNRDGFASTFRNNGSIPDPGADVRPFADVIDDPNEVANGEVHLRFNRPPASGTDTGGPADSLWTSTRGDVTPGEPGLNSRATFARHLYVLAMFLTRNAADGSEFEFPFDNSLPFIALGENPLTFEEEFRAWKIAQWAVNVADFRDTDAIMTRFDYDPNPFDGWEVVNVGGDVNRPTYRTVWGLEFPELTLEESLAFHDRRVRDTDQDPSGSRVISIGGTRGSDGDLDQYQIPLGSLFLEIRNTRSPQPVRVQSTEPAETANPMAFPSELYVNRGRADNPNWMLDLAAEAPDQNPVWRVAITQFHNATTRPESCPDFLLKPVGSDGTSNTFGSGPALDRDTTTLDPSRPQFFSNAITNSSIDRVVWFSGRDPDPNDDGAVDIPVPVDSAAPGRIFYNRSGNRYLAPGQIAVIGPRASTPIGTAFYDDMANLVIDPDGAVQVDPDKFAPQQNIVLLTDRIQMRDRLGATSTPIFDTQGGAVAGATARPILGITAASNPPVRWTDPDTRDRVIGLNISEPYEILGTTASYPAGRDYYREPEERLSDRTNAGFAYAIDSWRNFDSNRGQLPDVPFDGVSGAELRDTLGPQGQRTGTREHYKTAYLQRLADPTLPYNAQTNPYISLDYISLDLTVFNGSQDNGDDSNTDAMGIIWPDPVDRDPFNSGPEERFGSRYKSGLPLNVDVGSAVEYANLTHSVSTVPPVDTAAAARPAVLPPPVGQAIDICRIPLSILARSEDINRYDPAIIGPAAYSLELQKHTTTMGWTNRSYGRRWQQPGMPNNLFTPFVGLPINWLTNISWLNRNFVSPEELMWVPASGPGRLCFEFTSASVASGLPAGSDPYDDTQNDTPATNRTDQRRYGFNQRFTHLFNFFSSNDNDFDTAGAASPNFWRLLEWVEVPPPFDADVDFISPEQDILMTGEQSVIPPLFNYASFFNNTGPGSYIDADPLTWNFASTLGGNRNYNGNGSWAAATPPGTGRSNGFWTDHVSMDMFRPPFSFRSKTYRKGLINLNTVKNHRVYKALMHGFSTDAERAATGTFSPTDATEIGAFWGAFHNSRRGYAYAPDLSVTPGDGRLRPSLSNTSPTQLDGVFKPANSANIRPQLTGLANKNPLDSTTMRPNPTTPTLPLFQRAAAPGASSQAQSYDRSVVHNQLGQTRLSNLATGQSNVYAVWITVGLFEVDGSTMTVGQEIGSDTGRVRRAKGFFIIDRSVPVMYRPGELNNAFDTVKLSRIVD